MRLDILWALRGLRRTPFFSAAITIFLAIGAGATTAVFSIADAVLFRPEPYPAAGRLVRVEESSTARNLSGVPVRDYDRWAARRDIFERVAPYLRDTVTLTGGGEPEQVIAVRSVGLFPMLGVTAQSGRPLIDSDDREGPRHVAVLSDRLWRRRYHADPGVIGRGITISDELYTIVGVMPAEFDFRYSEADLWTPMRLTPSSPWVQVVAKLKAGVSLEQARSALAIIAAQLEREQPKEHAGLKISAVPWNDAPDPQYRLTLIVVLAAVALLMLIACADAGSLLLARAVERQREISIRASLGAGTWRILRQLVAESFVLAVLGCVAGIAVAQWVLQILTKQLAALPIVVPHLQRVALNGRVLFFSASLCMLLTVLCSVAPMLLALKLDLQSGLRNGPANAPSRGPSQLFAGLIALEAAFAFMLLAGSGLLIRSLAQLQAEDHGFRPDHVLTLRVPVGTLTQPRPTGKYDTRVRQMAYYRDILERVKTVPGIKAAAIVNNLPLSGINTSLMFNFGPRNTGEQEMTSARTISPDYFAAMGIPLVAGRTFTDRDQAGAPDVAIINEYLAHWLFADRSPLGQRLTVESKPGPTIVGVVRNSSQLSYELPVKGEVYIPYQQFLFAAFMSTIVVRTEGDPTALAPALRQQVWSVDPNQPVVKVETMDQVIANSIWRPRFSAWIVSALGVLSMLLTAIGVYGIVVYTSNLRAKEAGIRVALGATPRNILATVLRSALLPVALGVCGGVVVAGVVSRGITHLLHGINATDPVTFLSAAAVVILVGGIASLQPALRAAMRDPLPTLRSE